MQGWARSAPLVAGWTFALLAELFLGSVALAASGLVAGGLNEFNVELPSELRLLAGRGTPTPVAHALVTIAVPADFDPRREWPLMVVSATSDPGYNSSRRLLREYAGTALAHGWLLIAADPLEEVAAEKDEVVLRYALDVAALAVLQRQWPNAGKAALAFGGFSGGSKYSGWLAAAFASQGRAVMGIYAAGINRNAILSAAQDFKVLDEAFKRVPVFLQSGEMDEIATPDDHRRIHDELRKAGFRNVRVEYFPGPHRVDVGPLAQALDWFRELAAEPQSSRP